MPWFSGGNASLTVRVQNDLRQAYFHLKFLQPERKRPDYNDRVTS